MVVDAVCVGPDREQHLFAAGQRYVLLLYWQWRAMSTGSFGGPEASWAVGAVGAVLARVGDSVSR